MSGYLSLCCIKFFYHTYFNLSLVSPSKGSAKSLEYLCEYFLYEESFEKSFVILMPSMSNV